MGCEFLTAITLYLHFLVSSCVISRDVLQCSCLRHKILVAHKQVKVSVKAVEARRVVRHRGSRIYLNNRLTDGEVVVALRNSNVPDSYADGTRFDPRPGYRPWLCSASPD
jgi:hypothetical protein